MCLTADRERLMVHQFQEGLHIGDLYSLRANNSTELIPRNKISYVSAKYTSRPVLAVIGTFLLIVAAASYLEPSIRLSVMQLIGSGPAEAVFWPAITGALFILWYFMSRRVGILIASSGGQIFVETRGRGRFELLERIRADLSNYQRSTPEYITPLAHVDTDLVAKR